MCAAGCAAVIAVVLAPSVASGERGTSSSAQVVPQRIVLPAPAAAPVLPVDRAVKAATMRREPIRVDMAATEVTTRDCAGASGAETKLGMLERSAVWGHCDSTR
jgi:hypothetical protein